MSFAGFLDIARKDVTIPSTAPTSLLTDAHAEFIRAFEANKQGYEYIMAEPLRVSGIYWCVGAMDIMDKLSLMDRDAIVAYVLGSQLPNGGFAPAEGHDAHLLHTLCAVQLLYILGAMNQLTAEARERIVQFVKVRQLPDGSFTGDESGEVDTRFSMVALATLYLLDRLDAVDIDAAAAFIIACHNGDGGFGTRPGSESHAGQVYCSVAALLIVGRLESIDRDRTAEWLAFRQCASGGLNGRPEKLPDVCYSWWVLASLAILRRLDWIDRPKMIRFITACQDTETGGFSDRPGDYPDPFHTIFGLAALSLLGEEKLAPVDAVLCMTRRVLGEKSFTL